jgi:hypothetical protein
MLEQSGTTCDASRNPTSHELSIGPDPEHTSADVTLREAWFPD